MMTGSDYLKLKARSDKMDKKLLRLSRVCHIDLPVALNQVQDVVDEHGLDIALACMKLLSVSVRDYRLTVIEQFMEIVEAKIGGILQEGQERDLEGEDAD